MTHLDSRLARGRRAATEDPQAPAGGPLVVVTPPTERRFCGVEEFARICGMSRSHAYELVARRQIPVLRLGRRVLIPLSFLDDLDLRHHDESA